MVYDIFFDIGFALEKDDEKYSYYYDEPGSASIKLKIMYSEAILYKLYSETKKEIDSSHANQYFSGKLEFKGGHSIKTKHNKVMKELSVNVISLMSMEKEHIERVLSDSIKVKNYLSRTKSNNNEIRKKDVDDDLEENRIQFSRLLNKFVNSMETLLDELSKNKYEWQSVEFPEPNNQNVLHLYAMFAVIAISELRPDEMNSNDAKTLKEYAEKIRILVNEYFMNLPGSSSTKKVYKESEEDDKKADRLMNDEDVKLLRLMVHRINISRGYQMSELEMSELFDELASITQTIRSAKIEVWRQYDLVQKKKSIEEQYNFVKEFEALESGLDKEFENSGANIKL